MVGIISVSGCNKTKEKREKCGQWEMACQSGASSVFSLGCVCVRMLKLYIVRFVYYYGQDFH